MGNAERIDKMCAEEENPLPGKNHFAGEHGKPPGLKKAQFPIFAFKSVTPLKVSFLIVANQLHDGTVKFVGQQ
jgi:hypothetical protein